MPLRSKIIQAMNHIQRKFCIIPPVTWHVVSDPGALDDPLRLPCEICYHLAIHPMRYQAMKDFLTRGGGIAFTRSHAIPSRVLTAVRRISQTQGGSLYPWLEDLLLRSCRPVWSEEDAEEAEQFGIQLENELQQIQAYQRGQFSVSMIKAGRMDATDDDAALVEDLRRDLQSLHAAESAYQISLAVQQGTTDVILFTAFALFISAPVAHVLNLIFSGFGTVFLALAVAVFHESRFLHRAYEYGNAPWQMRQMLLHRAPYMLAALCSACLVQFFMPARMFALAGFSFAFAVMLFPLRSFAVHFFEARRRHQRLMVRGNGSAEQACRLLAHDGPAWWIRPFSLFFAFGFIPLLFILFPQLFLNGWFLSGLAISPVWVYYGFSHIWRLALGWRFEQRIHRLLAHTIIIPSPFI